MATDDLTRTYAQQLGMSRRAGEKPSNPGLWEPFFDPILGTLEIFNGTSWVEVGGETPVTPTLTQGLLGYFDMSGADLNDLDDLTLTNTQTMDGRAAGVNIALDIVDFLITPRALEATAPLTADQSSLDWDGGTLTLGDTFSIQFWLQVEDLTTTGGVFAGFSATATGAPLTTVPHVRTTATVNTIEVADGDGNFDPVVITGDGAAWVHFVLSYNSANDLVRWYVNGVKIMERIFAAISFATSNFVVWPWNPGGLNDVKIRGMEEVGLWDRQLTGPEVLDLFNANAGLAYPFTGAGGLGQLKNGVIEHFPFDANRTPAIAQGSDPYAEVGTLTFGVGDPGIPGGGVEVDATGEGLQTGAASQDAWWGHLDAFSVHFVYQSSDASLGADIAIISTHGDGPVANLDFITIDSVTNAIQVEMLGATTDGAMFPKFTGTTDIRDGNPHTISITWLKGTSGEGLTVYVDEGAAEGASANTLDEFPKMGSATDAARDEYGGLPNVFLVSSVDNIGVIGDLYYYNRELTSEDHLALYNGGTNVRFTDLGFDENGPNNLNDQLVFLHQFDNDGNGDTPAVGTTATDQNPVYANITGSSIPSNFTRHMTNDVLYLESADVLTTRGANADATVANGITMVIWCIQDTTPTGPTFFYKPNADTKWIGIGIGNSTNAGWGTIDSGTFDPSDLVTDDWATVDFAGQSSLFTADTVDWRMYTRVQAFGSATSTHWRDDTFFGTSSSTVLGVAPADTWNGGALHIEAVDTTRIAMAGIWNRVLTPADLFTLFNQGKGLLFSKYKLTGA